MLLLAVALASLMLLIIGWFLYIVAVRYTCLPVQGTSHTWDYDNLQKILQQSECSVPIGIVNVDVFDRNTDRFIAALRKHGKRLRVATKSVRVPALVERVVERGAGDVVGLMCFSVSELRVYGKPGGKVKNILMAYPIVQRSELLECWQACTSNHELALTLMVDCPEHVRRIGMCWIEESLCKANGTRGRQLTGSHDHVKRPGNMARLCIDVDMAFRPVSGVYIGAHRSPCRTADHIENILHTVAAVNVYWRDVSGSSQGTASAETLQGHYDQVCKLPWSEKMGLLKGPVVTINSVMGYEAHIAGVPDSSIWDPFRNVLVRLMKRVFEKSIQRQRSTACKHLQSRGVALEFVNGGGTGSLLSTQADTNVNEATVGSGLLQSRLFDFYEANTASPALVYALAVTRTSRTAGSEYVTCQSGGFIASGEVSRDKAPCVFLPEGYDEVPTEGFGEVQTPLRRSAASARRLSIGDYVFLRPAKAGEIAERFDRYLLIGDNSEEVTEVKTYRGMGITAY